MVLLPFQRNRGWLQNGFNMLFSEIGGGQRMVFYRIISPNLIKIGGGERMVLINRGCSENGCTMITPN